MTYDLRTQDWIPYLRRSGQKIDWGPPWLLTDRLDSDPIVALAAPRPEFNGALLELLIGILTVALAPKNEDEWLLQWENPPSPDLLRERIEALPDAFDLDAPGPAFLQDFSEEDLANVDVVPIEQLLIDVASDSRAFFVKRDRVHHLGRSAAAMALLTLQTDAPSGGRGHRTSLRGGGPLTTLVDPRLTSEEEGPAHHQPLWRMLWVNVETGKQWEDRASKLDHTQPTDLFPWLAPTRHSEPKGGRPTTPLDAHPLQCYFGCPRRIRLEFAGAGTCDITGRPDERMVTGFRMRSYGMQYDGWQHPLSPYYRPKPTSPWLAVHGQPSGIGWRDWVGLTCLTPDPSTYRPAQTVAHFISQRAEAIGQQQFRVHAFGFDFDNMKSRAWIDAVLPAFVITDHDHLHALYTFARRVTDATAIATSALAFAVDHVRFVRPEDAGGDRSYIKLELWDATTVSFYTAVQRIATSKEYAKSLDHECAQFAIVIAQHGLDVFDQHCAVNGAPPDLLRRMITERFNLTMTLRGYSKLGKKFFDALGIAPAKAKTKTSAHSRSKRVKTP